jgi:hypothetical protein
MILDSQVYDKSLVYLIEALYVFRAYQSPMSRSRSTINKSSRHR